MAKRSTKATTNCFPVKKRKELDGYLSALTEDQCTDVSKRAIQKVTESLHVKIFPTHFLTALTEESGKPYLVECVKAMTSFTLFLGVPVSMLRPHPLYDTARTCRVCGRIGGQLKIVALSNLAILPVLSN